MRAVVVVLVVVVLTGCTQGATPDCSQVKCGPDLDGSFFDATTEAATDTGVVEAGDSAADAPADAPDAG